jgi:hypothetical protein
VGRHDHVTCVRSDGLSAVLRPLLADARIVAATLVDVDSGLILDGWSDDPAVGDLDLLGAGHADLARAAGAVRRGPVRHGEGELVVDSRDGRHHVLLEVPDPHGDRLVVAVVVAGRARHVERARRQLRAIPIAALTEGPSLRRRPVDGAWFPTEPIPTPRAASAAPAPDQEVARQEVAVGGAAPPAAMVPGSGAAP